MAHPLHKIRANHVRISSTALGAANINRSLTQMHHSVRDEWRDINLPSAHSVPDGQSVTAADGDGVTRKTVKCIEEVEPRKRRDRVAHRSQPQSRRTSPGLSASTDLIALNDE